MKRRSFLGAFAALVAASCGRISGELRGILNPESSREPTVTIVGSAGAVFEGSVSAKTPLEALQAAARATGLPAPVVRTVGDARYVASFGGDAEFWRYWINDVLPLQPANVPVLAPGSIVRWRFGP